MSEAQTPARPVLPSESERYVTLREFEQRMSEFRQLMDERTRYEREILSTRENSMKTASELAADELARRLEELNHAHRNAMENWAKSLPREMFEQFQQEFRAWKDEINTHAAARSQLPSLIAGLDKRIDDLERALQNGLGALTFIRFMGFAGVIALIGTFLSMAGVVP